MGEQFTITLPEELARLVREKVSSGEYASVDDVVGEALWHEFDGAPHSDPEIEHWLRTEVVAAIREYEANPDDVLTAEEVFAEIKAELKASQAQ